jgi:hypothetical protein
MPATVAPASFQAPQGLITFHRPELAGAFEAALVLSAGGLDGPGTQGLGRHDLLGRGRCAFLDGLAGGQDGAVVLSLA